MDPIMPLPLLVLFAVLGFGGVILGSLMLFVPLRFGYGGFLNERVMNRQHTERDRALAVRAQGLIALASGAFFLMFVWALH